MGKILFCLATFVFSNTLFAKENLAFSMGSDFIIGGTLDRNYSGEELIIGKGHTDPIIDALSRYYEAARNEDLRMLSNIHHLEDGSRQRLDQEISKNPTKYTGFKNLSKVVLGRIIFWESYRAIEVKWLSKTGKLVNWIELVNCDDICFMSDKLIHRDTDFSLLSSFISLTKSRTDATKFGSTTDICIDGKSLCNNPLKISIEAKKIPGKLEIFKGKKYIEKEYNYLSDLLKSVWRVDDKEITNAQDYAALESLALKSLQCCVKNVHEKYLYPQYQDKGDSLELVYLTPSALFQFLRKIARVELYSKYEYENFEYLYAKVHTNDGATRNHVFIFEKRKNTEGKLIGQTENFLIDGVLLHPKVFGSVF